MRIVGHGIDLVETGRIGELLDQHQTRFLERCFTHAEREYCCPGFSGSEKSRSTQHQHRSTRAVRTRLAGRFAAKEAVLKVLGTGWSGGIAWTDIEVSRLPSGRPEVVLHRESRRIADQLDIDQWWLSITHIDTHAIASAIGVCTS